MNAAYIENNTLVLEFVIPGRDVDDISIELDDNRKIVVSANPKEVHPSSVLSRGILFTADIPEDYDLDQIQTYLKAGILLVMIPVIKAETIDVPLDTASLLAGLTRNFRLN